MKETALKAAELAEELGLPPRQIRYMITEGIIPGANGMGRGVDGFDERHLAAGRRYLELKAQGRSSYEVKRIMSAERLVPIHEGHAVSLMVDPNVDPSSIDVETLVSDLAAALRSYAKTGKE